MRVLFFAACLASLAAPTSAQTQTQPAPAPTPDALIDQLVRVLPHQGEFDIQPRFDPQDLARLAALNPGREPEIRTILMAHATCSNPFLKDATRRAIRGIARELGAAKVGQLIAFYQGPDEKIFERISDAADKGQQPSAADEKEVERIMAAYPLMEWTRGVNGAARLFTDDQSFMQGITRCATEKQAALSRAKLKTR